MDPRMKALMKGYHEQARDLAERNLSEAGTPMRCERCGGRPGEVGCGKVIHIELEEAFYAAYASLFKGAKRPELIDPWNEEEK